jgi:hypothetical protein
MIACFVRSRVCVEVQCLCGGLVSLKSTSYPRRSTLWTNWLEKHARRKPESFLWAWLFASVAVFSHLITVKATPRQQLDAWWTYQAEDASGITPASSEVCSSLFLNVELREMQKKDGLLCKSRCNLPISFAIRVDNYL